MFSSSIFSQTTSTVNKYPKINILGPDTVISFLIPQARSLAEIVVIKKSQDTIIQNMIEKDSLCQATVNNEKMEITNLKTEIDNLKNIDDLRVKQLTDMDKVSKLQEKEIKKERMKRKLTVVGAVLVEALTIAAFIIL